MAGLGKKRGMEKITFLAKFLSFLGKTRRNDKKKIE
jgi:hypothetical protein